MVSVWNNTVPWPDGILSDVLRGEAGSHLHLLLNMFNLTRAC